MFVLCLSSRPYLNEKNQKRFSMSYANNVCDRSLFCNVFEIFFGYAFNKTSRRYAQSK